MDVNNGFRDAHTAGTGIAWHLREADGLHTDIGFNRFQLVTQQWTNYRGRPLGHVTADLYDQWDPALDPADDGTYMTQWYDKRNDINNGMKTQWNSLYQVYACKILPDGTPVDGTDTIVYNTTAADPSALPRLQGTCLGDANKQRYMGEYQDIWEWYGTWYGATTYIANGQQDIYLTRIRP